MSSADSETITGIDTSLLADPSTFAIPAELTVNVILTFESEDDDGASQEVYETDVTIDLGNDDLDAMEVDFIGNVLEASSRSLENLVKISLCLMGLVDHVRAGSPALDRAIDHIVRHDGKYYFQPNQRDPHEQAIVDAYGIAMLTSEI